MKYELGSLVRVRNIASFFHGRHGRVERYIWPDAHNPLLFIRLLPESDGPHLPVNEDELVLEEDTP